jgi:hypothetical protein
MLKRKAVVLCVLQWLLTYAAAEDARPAEKELGKAKLLAEEGDLRRSVPLLFEVLRKTESDGARQESHNYLEALGFSRQEIFQLDPSLLSVEEWTRLLNKLNTASAERQRQAVDSDYAQGLLRLAITPHTDASGALSVDVQPKDLARALEILLKVALSDNGERGRDAQARLEALGISGPKAETIRKAAVEGKLPAEVQNEVVCELLMQNLSKYKEWSEKAEDNDENATQKAVGTERGTALFKLLKKEYGQTAAFKRHSDLSDYWSNLLAPIAKGEKQDF